MAVPVARVHLKMAHAALPALLPTPPTWKMLPVFPITTPCVAAILPNAKLPANAKPSRADADDRWDAHKTMSTSSSPRSNCADSIRSCAGRGSSRKNATSPPPMPGRADSVERWDAHKKAAASPASSSSSSGTSSIVSSSKWPMSRLSSAERWDVHKKSRPPQAKAKLLDDGESSNAASNDIEVKEEEEVLWKPRAMYAGPGFVVAAPEPSMIPMPTAFLVHAA